MPVDVLAPFHPASRRWFEASLGEPTAAQRAAWPSIVAGEHTLVVAPTGSGKTLAAFFAALDSIASGAQACEGASVHTLYVSPIKALTTDVRRNLRAPILGISGARREGDSPLREVTIGERTGDTPPRERERMRRHPPDVLVTTPESLFLMMTSEARHVFRGLRAIIVDEVHALVATKRGAHLALTLERLERVRDPGLAPLQRIGLSATVEPLDEAARFLGGYGARGPRAVSIADARAARPIAISVEGFEGLGAIEDELGAPAAERGVWPLVHERLLGRVREHRTTMIFANSRRLAERIAAGVNELAEEEVALAHHGSLAREQRAVIEERLKRGDLPAIVATSSLELGLDLGSVDFVAQVEAPLSIASGLQRLGRANHHVGGTPRGLLLPKHPGDLVACVASAVAMRAGAIESMAFPRSPLDVLAQQIAAIVAIEPGIHVDAVKAIARKSAPFHETPEEAIDGVLDLLAGRYPSVEFAELRPRLQWDRVTGELVPRPGLQRLVVANGGTIADRGLYGVFLAAGDDTAKGGRRVGELDEEMVFELREGEVFFLGASSWRCEEIRHDRVLVSPAPGEPGKMPFWHGESLGRSFALGLRVGTLLREVEGVVRKRSGAARTAARIREEAGLDEVGWENLTRYVRDQVESESALPTDRRIVVERFVDELGDERIVVLSPFGGRVHAPLCMAILAELRERLPGEVDGIWTDDALVFRLPERDEPTPLAWLLPRSDEIEARITAAVGASPLFSARFRESASRSLLLPRRRPGERQPLWAQRKRAQDLLAVASRYPAFPLLLETHREVLRDAFDVPSLRAVLEGIERRTIEVTAKDVSAPSPFAASALFGFVASFIYSGDAPLQERRLQALTVDHAQLRALLGEAALRTLFSDETLEAAARELALEDHPVLDAEALVDRLRRLGDRSDLEIEALRAGALRDELVASRRALVVRIAGEARTIAIEDAGLYRDALGVVPPHGVPAAFLEPVSSALEGLALRFARRRLPFDASIFAARFGIGIEAARVALEALAGAGRLEAGAFLPGGSSREYVHPEVLALLRRKTRAELRAAVEPVSPAAYTAALHAWQHLDAPRAGKSALLEVVRQLEGAPIHASALEQDVLPARIAGYAPSELDALMLRGEVVWVGIEASGPVDGRVALHLADHDALLARTAPRVEGALVDGVRTALERRGASFFAELLRAVPAPKGDLAEALWSLIWSGEVVADSLEPLRSRLRGATAATKRSHPRHGSADPSSPPGTEGRFSLRARRWIDEPTAPARALAVVQGLLERYGVLLRDVAKHELVPGGFSALYTVLRSLEDGGRVRSGYFVEGGGGAQFALPGADANLRAKRDPGSRTVGPESARDDGDAPLVLAATDPAQPYGSMFPWPSAAASDARIQRVPGAVVVYRQGRPLAYLTRSHASLVTFPSGEPADVPLDEAAIVRGLSEWIGSRRGPRALHLTEIDGVAAHAHPLRRALESRGGVRSGEGITLRKG
jgi:ATP-dependent Lhr-like helicase